MLESISRRALLTAAIILPGCSQQMASHQYIVTTTEASQEAFYEIVERFAEDERLKVVEEPVRLGEELGRLWRLEGWRSTIYIQSEYDGRHFIPNTFRASVISTMNPMPWAMSDGELEGLAGRFERAALAGPDIGVERQSIYGVSRLRMKRSSPS